MTDWQQLTRQALNGIKPYVPGKPIEEVQREYGLTDVIKLASNENPLGPAPKAMEAIKNGLANAHLYPDGSCFRLRQTLSAFQGLPAECFIIGNGSDEIIKLLAEAFINEGDEAVMGQPSFSEYDFAVTLMGGKMVKVPVREDFALDLEAMAAAVTDRTKLIFLCNPNNPTGALVGGGEVANFLDRIPENIVVVFDEAYFEYVEDPAYSK